MTSLQTYRFRYHLHQKMRAIKRILLRPVCWIIGHNTYDDSDFVSGNLRCTRCAFYNPLWRPESIWNIGNYTFHTKWSEETREYIATCDEYPSLSWIHKDREQAFLGIARLVHETATEEIDDPIA